MESDNILQNEDKQKNKIKIHRSLLIGLVLIGIAVILFFAWILSALSAMKNMGTHYPV